MMRTVMKSADFKELVIVRDFKEGFGTKEGMQENEFRFDHKSVSGSEREILLDGLIISHRDHRVFQEFAIEIDHNFPFMKMQFELEGYSNFARQHKGCQDVDIPAGRHQLFYFPEVKGKLTYPPSHRYTLEVILSVDYLRRSLGDELEILGHFGKAVQKGVPVQLFAQSQQITPAMKTVILDFIHCHFTGAARRLFFEAKIMELLAMQIDYWNHFELKPADKNLKTLDVEKLHYVREMLSQQPGQAYTLSGISQMSGLNDFKLKQGFKAIFNQTVFGYLTHVRMENAKKLLLETDVSIAEIAFENGYKNPQHFSAAFKKKYGCLPRSIR